MNLVTDPWLSFQLRDGSEKVLPLSSISHHDVIDFALPRADFQGGAYQLVIGLLQTTFAPDDGEHWLELFEEPPSTNTLQTAFDTVAHAFQTTGDGALFMQDFDTLDNANTTSISGLLIEAPGENGLKLNTDHFIKRGIGSVMSLAMANIALFTLQTNAPSGGQGHRTGLRGGGPLTTLVLPQQDNASLWQKLWLNIINREEWSYTDPDLHSPSLFPWLDATQTSEKKGSDILSNTVHPLHVFWAMPRRIRLIVQDEAATCQLTGETTTQHVTHYRTQNYGGNYAGEWQHPLTPYTFDPKKPDKEPLSVKGQPGGIQYKIWDMLTFSSDDTGLRCALVVQQFHHLYGEELLEMHFHTMPRLWVFGYDMDNMKARGWYSVSMPLFAIPPQQQQKLLEETRKLQKLSQEVLATCRRTIKEAWFNKPKEAKGDMSFIDMAFWQRSENAFYQAVAHMVQHAAIQNGRLSPEAAKQCLMVLRRTAQDLFDEYALTDVGNQRDIARKIKARQALIGWLYTQKKKNVITNFIHDNQIDTLKEAS